MTETEVLRAFRIWDTVSYLDIKGQVQQGVCIGWGLSTATRQRYMVIQQPGISSEKHIPLSNVICKASNIENRRKTA